MAGEGTVERGWRVSGGVQGVGFRWSTRNRARELGLSGWVRNEPDGTVRVRARGADDALDALEGWLHRGPPSARVSEVMREEGPGSPADEVEPGGFEIRH